MSGAGGAGMYCTGAAGMLSIGMPGYWTGPGMGTYWGRIVGTAAAACGCLLEDTVLLLRRCSRGGACPVLTICANLLARCSLDQFCTK